MRSTSTSGGHRQRIDAGSRIRFVFVMQRFVHCRVRLERSPVNPDVGFGFPSEPVIKFRHQSVQQIAIGLCEIESVFVEPVENIPVSSDAKLAFSFVTLKLCDGLVDYGPLDGWTEIGNKIDASVLRYDYRKAMPLCLMKIRRTGRPN